MDLIDTFVSWLSNPVFYGVLIAIALFAYGIIRSLRLNRIVIFRKNMLLIIGVVGLVLTSGIFGALNLGSLSDDGVSSGWTISDVQVTGLSSSSAGGSVALDANNPYVINARHTDAQSNETTAIYEVNSSTFTITRTGDLKADSCLVTVNSADFYGNEVTGTVSSTPYNILEKDATGRFKTYLKDAATQATTSDSQGMVTVAFAEGVATEQFTLLANVDEESQDALNQYSTRTWQIDVCGFPVTVNEQLL